MSFEYQFEYQKEVENYKWDIPEYLNMAEDCIERNIKLGKGAQVAFYWENAIGETRDVTFNELSLLTNQFGNVLKELGIKKGERILFRTPNIPEYVVAFLGAVKIGAVPIPSSTLFREPEVEYRLNDSGAVAVFTTDDFAAAVENVQYNCPSLNHIIVLGSTKEGQLSYSELMSKASPELAIENSHREDMSFMLYTSGTTGNPKAAVHAQRYVIGHDPNAYYWAAYQPGDVVSHIGELNWIFTILNNFLLPLRHGVSFVIYQGAGGFDPEKWFQLIEKYKISNFACTPTGYRMLLTVSEAKEKYDLSSLRQCISAGEPLPDNTYFEWKNHFGIDILDGIGQTECMVFCSNMPGMTIYPDSCGKPQPGHTCAILDDEGNIMPLGSSGQLAVRRDDPGLMLGYWNKPEKTAEVFKGEWYWTGDTLTIDEEGFYWFKGRGDDLIKASGYRISPFEVESCLAAHPAVLESAAVESPDEMRGNVVKAYIVLRENYEPSEELIKDIQNHVKQHSAPFKYPRKVEFLTQLPKTQSGKIKRKDLREKEFTVNQEK